MGGDLRNAPKGKAPTFLVASLKDPYRGNLDRIQIIKGWLDSEGKTHERVYDVAVSDGRKIDEDGRCKTLVGNTVDVPNATWKNTIGDSELITTWKDPDFDAGQKAWYYTRVVENPSCRWSQRICAANGVNCQDPRTIGHGLEECCAADHRPVIQERAWSSPIWYTASNNQE